MYKATRASSLKGVVPRFVITVSPDTRLAGDEHLLVHNGLVYDQRTGQPLHVDGRRIEILAIDLRVGEE
jgi:hypothetical protein